MTTAYGYERFCIDGCALAAIGAENVWEWVVVPCALTRRDRCYLRSRSTRVEIPRRSTSTVKSDDVDVNDADNATDASPLSDLEDASVADAPSDDAALTGVVNIGDCGDMTTSATVVYHVVFNSAYQVGSITLAFVNRYFHSIFIHSRSLAFVNHDLPCLCF
jgi:hypothetical protein